MNIQARLKLLISASLLENPRLNVHNHSSLSYEYALIQTPCAFSRITVNVRPITMYIENIIKKFTRVEVNDTNVTGNLEPIIWQHIAFGTHSLKDRPLRIIRALPCHKILHEFLLDLHHTLGMVFKSPRLEECIRRMEDLPKPLEKSTHQLSQQCEILCNDPNLKGVFHLVHQYTVRSSDPGNRIITSPDKINICRRDVTIHLFPSVVTLLQTINHFVGTYGKHVVVAINKHTVFAKVAVRAILADGLATIGKKRPINPFKFQKLSGKGIMAKIEGFRQGSHGLLLVENNDGIDLSETRALILFGYDDWTYAIQAVGRVDRLSSASTPVDIIVC